MVVDFSNIESWVFWTAALIVAFIILRFFLHAIVRIAQFAIRFLWRGCLIGALLLAIYLVLRAMEIL
jgi:hypothetical protein